MNEFYFVIQQFTYHRMMYRAWQLLKVVIIKKRSKHISGNSYCKQLVNQHFNANISDNQRYLYVNKVQAMSCIEVGSLIRQFDVEIVRIKYSLAVDRASQRARFADATQLAIEARAAGHGATACVAAASNTRYELPALRRASSLCLRATSYEPPKLPALAQPRLAPE